jgi:hypothetical protein
MTMKHTVSGVIIAATQSQWVRTALMALAILAPVLTLAGCASPHH